MAKNDIQPAVPRHVGIIMDGNGRWAKRRGLPRLAGHRAGGQNLRRVIRAARDAGIRYLTLYAFSTENWNRPAEEVSGLMALLDEFLEKEIASLHAEGVRLVHIGNLQVLEAALRKRIEDSVSLTKDNRAITVVLAFNYGGRDEIVRAVRKLIAAGLPAESVTQETLTAAMDTAGIPDPDLVIRTSGEQRTSNFLTWQSAYSEWVFTPTLWPDFDEKTLQDALAEYAGRDRRFGRISES
jgi:undecaprenyl diphosphate synthase